MKSKNETIGCIHFAGLKVWRIIETMEYYKITSGTLTLVDVIETMM